MHAMSGLATRIRQRRLARRMSQPELAFAVGTDQRSISRYENDRVTPTADVIVAIARELETTTDYLLGVTDDPERPLRSELDLDDVERHVLRLLRSHSPDERQKMLAVLQAMA